MPKFLVEVKYTEDGAKGLLAEGGSSRVAASTTLIESLGGKLESFYFAFGEADAFVVIDVPDNASAAAAALITRASGGVVSRMILLATPGDIDAASRKQGDFRPPGE